MTALLRSRSASTSQHWPALMSGVLERSTVRGLHPVFLWDEHPREIVAVNDELSANRYGVLLSQSLAILTIQSPVGIFIR